MKKFLLVLLLVLTGYGVYRGYSIYQWVYAPNVNLLESEDYLYIPSGSNYEDVYNILDKYVVADGESFAFVAEMRNLPKHIYPGRYRITTGMSNYELTGLLRSGVQEPVQVILQTTRTKEMVAGMASKHLEADSVSLLKILQNENLLSNYGVDNYTWMTLFVPNTYEFYWNTSAEEFLERMVKERKRFWNEEREAKAAKLNLTYEEVSTLASIVQQETVKEDEQAKVAGVYLNRIRRGMHLGADPTLIFASGDFTITRVLNEHKLIDSPYNTYTNLGLPPGPICIPTISNIDAVLEDLRHKYYYFCAKPDFSGYHNFARTLGQHEVNAAAFRRELNRRRIYN